jgi:NAD-dependent deacetylase
MPSEKKNLVVITGAGMSAESGLATFRDGNGLWNDHRIEDVATPDAWRRNPTLVLDFYNQRRKQLFEVEPNIGHQALADLQRDFHVQIITQNVDDLHERAGSQNVMHLHGELRKVRSLTHSDTVLHWTEDLNLGDLCPHGGQLRPHIVWFGESVPLMEDAVLLIALADYVLIIGSSMQVYPAASLVHFAPSSALCYYIDPKPSINPELRRRSHLSVVELPGTIGVPLVAEELRKLLV